jgi:hypothetical protein
MASADQIRQPEGDKLPTQHDGNQQSLVDHLEHMFNGGNQKATNAADSAALVQSQALPDLQIDHHESGFMHFVHGAEAVGADLAKGAVDELIHHPGQVIEAALTGLAVGTVAALAAPELAVGLAIGGAAVGAYELATHVGGWIHSADVVSNTQDHSAAEVALAHQDLQNVGGGGVLIGAGMLGAMDGDALAGVMRSGYNEATGATVSDILANSVRSGRYESVDIGGVTVLRPVEYPVTPQQGAMIGTAGILSGRAHD